MERLALPEWNKDPDYLQAIKDYHNRISEITRKGCEEFSPIGIPGYSLEQERMLTIAVATVIDPEILKLSHCNHRAVAATVAMYFEDLPDESVMNIVNGLPGFSMYTPGEDKSSKDRILLVNGYNNWFGANGNNIHYCKVMPGLPHNVDPKWLSHLGESIIIEDISQVDSACPKRMRVNTGCEIEHAERSAIRNSTAILKKIGIKPPDHTMLAVTWVPCPACTAEIVNSSFGKDIDVFSVFGAREDEDDKRMAQEIKRQLAESGPDPDMFGPHIMMMNKDAGYGWFPASHRARKYIESLSGTRVPAKRQPVKLIQNALKLLD